MAVALWSGWTWVEMSLPPRCVSALCFGRKGERELLVLLWSLLVLLLIHYNMEQGRIECSSQVGNEAWPEPPWVSGLRMVS